MGTKPYGGRCGDARSSASERHREKYYSRNTKDSERSELPGGHRNNKRSRKDYDTSEIYDGRIDCKRTRKSHDTRSDTYEESKCYKNGTRGSGRSDTYEESECYKNGTRGSGRYQTVEDSIERKNDIKDCDRNPIFHFLDCWCNLGRDYQYFEQPFACTHCHSRSVISLADYAKTHSVIIAYVPPGDTTNDTFVDAKIETLVILRGGARALGQIHRSGKSLGGLFNLSDLLLDSRLCVRFDSRKALDLQTSSDELNEADYAQYGIIVTRDFFGGQALPVDISRWICLLEDNPCQSVYLLEYSICLMEPRQAAGHFIWLYQHLGVLKTQGSRDYWFTIDKLTDRHPSWKVYLEETGKETVDLNALVKDIYSHNVEPGENPLFEDDAR